ncbi:MAG: MFS transporter [Zoogloeaceae bacterium]|nr:MFS transporter [Zoogloeaceae bacterium]
MAGTPRWLAPLLTRKMLICVFTGFSSGLPLFLLLQMLPIWLKEGGLDTATIGKFALAQMPFAWKFLWAPLLDRYALPLGRRRGWMASSQIALFLVIGVMGAFDPVAHLRLIFALSVVIAFLSATQDIALDAYRREILNDDAELGLGTAVHVNAYRIAGLVPGSLSLILAEMLPWGTVFWVTAFFMLPGLAMALLVREPPAIGAPRTLGAAVVEPFREFIGRKGWKAAALLLLFLLLYKLGDSLATALASVFYLEMGFSKQDIGLVAKHAMLWPALLGGMIGGLWMVRLGINRALWVFGVVQLVTILGFAWFAWVGPFDPDAITAANLWLLAAVIAAEYLGVGLGTAAFIAFIARNTHPAYTAAQFALFTCMTAVPRTVVNAFAGVWVEYLGWTRFFLICTLIAVPGMLLLFWVAPWNGEKEGA